MWVLGCKRCQYDDVERFVLCCSIVLGFENNVLCIVQANIKTPYYGMQLCLAYCFHLYYPTYYLNNINCICKIDLYQLVYCRLMGQQIVFVQCVMVFLLLCCSNDTFNKLKKQSPLLQFVITGFVYFWLKLCLNDVVQYILVSIRLSHHFR